jgi:hypothetical protein
MMKNPNQHLIRAAALPVLAGLLSMPIPVAAGSSVRTTQTALMTTDGTNPSARSTVSARASATATASSSINSGADGCRAASSATADAWANGKHEHDEHHQNARYPQGTCSAHSSATARAREGDDGTTSTGTAVGVHAQPGLDAATNVKGVPKKPSDKAS